MWRDRVGGGIRRVARVARGGRLFSGRGGSGPRDCGDAGEGRSVAGAGGGAVVCACLMGAFRGRKGLLFPRGVCYNRRQS